MGRRAWLSATGILLIVGTMALSSGNATAAGHGGSVVVKRGATLSRGGYDAGDKRLIEFGWDTPDVSYLSQHLAQMQDSPFDGVTFRIGPRMRAFEDRRWSTDEMQLPLLRGLQWGDLDDSFLVLNGPGPTTMNWFDDGHWRTILQNMRLVSQAVSASHAAGLFFDPEFYLSSSELSPWVYNAPTYPGHTPGQLEAKARERGREFVKALRSSVPDLKFLTLFAASHYCGQTVRPDGKFFLLVPFIKGMMDAGGRGFQLLDGHETSYNNARPGDFLADYAAVHRCSALDLDLLKAAGHGPQKHWDPHVRMAPGIYMDYVMGTRPQYPRLFSYDSRLQWLESNTYWALESADRYAWFYSEWADWWPGDDRPGEVDVVPAGVEGALTDAVRRVREGSPLGFDLSWPRGVLGAAGLAGPSAKDPPVSLRVHRHRLRASSQFRARAGVKPGAGVSQVRLFVDAAPTRRDVRPPFRFRFANGLRPGTHDLVVQATTSQGRTTAGPVRLQVRPRH
jgi:hypothetical protein